MSVLNYSNFKNGNFIASGIATYSDPTTFNLEYSGVNLQNGDAIVVRFPISFPSNGTLQVGSDYGKGIRNLSGELITGINANVPAILINTSYYWIIQGVQMSASLVDFEYDAAGDEIVPGNSNTWYNSTSQYVFRGTTTAPTLNDFIEYVDRTYHGRHSGETMKIDVTITGGCAKNTNTDIFSLYHQLRTIRSNVSTIQRIPLSLTESEQDGTTRQKGWRMSVNMSMFYNNVSLNEPIRVLLGGFGGIQSTATTNIPQDFYICSYNILISHFYN